MSFRSLELWSEHTPVIQRCLAPACLAAVPAVPAWLQLVSSALEDAGCTRRSAPSIRLAALAVDAGPPKIARHLPNLVPPITCKSNAV